MGDPVMSGSMGLQCKASHMAMQAVFHELPFHRQMRISILTVLSYHLPNGLVTSSGGSLLCHLLKQTLLGIESTVCGLDASGVQHAPEASSCLAVFCRADLIFFNPW